MYLCIVRVIYVSEFSDKCRLILKMNEEQETVDRLMSAREWVTEARDHLEVLDPELAKEAEEAQTVIEDRIKVHGDRTSDLSKEGAQRFGEGWRSLELDEECSRKFIPGKGYID